MLLIGSRALVINGIQLSRIPVDTDLMLTPSEYKQVIKFLKDDINKTIFIDKCRVAHKLKSGDVIEVEIAWPESSAEMLLQNKFDSETIQIGKHMFDMQVASLNVQLALKMSHRYRRNSPHFLKTMQDIHLLRNAGASIDHLGEFIKLREKETYGYQHPNLRRSKKDFFKDDAIKYVYDHDSIHEVVAHADKPAYRLFSASGEEVYSSRELWNRCSDETKLNAVVEESYVLALERSQIPFRGKIDPKCSFEMALMKVCSSITSGWFREYAWEHYAEALALYNPSYADKFFTAADLGKVKLFSSS